MGWDDRPYYRDRSDSTGGAVMAFLNGSVPLGTWFGIRVRAHSMLIVFVASVLLFGGIGEMGLRNAATSMAMLFVIVLLHEFGHCFAARAVGGEAHDILMGPLGGLAMADAPHRPRAQFLTAAGGPAVNVAICVLTAAAIWVIEGRAAFPLNPLARVFEMPGTTAGFYLWWVFAVSYGLLLFNLLPLYPLDGGQILQTLLWPSMGYFRSMNAACLVGMVGSGMLAVVGLLDIGTWQGWLLLMIALSCFTTCYSQRQQLRAMGPAEFQEAADYSASLYEPEAPRRRKFSRRSLKRARKLIRKEQAEQSRIDGILAKVSAHGMHSLSWWEKRCLRKATEHQRQRDLELSRDR